MYTLLHKNKKAYFDYEILNIWEAGIELQGYEVKAVRDKKVNLKGSYVSLFSGNAFLKGCHISPLACLPKGVIDPKKERKIFLHKKDLSFLSGKIKESGKTLIPLELYLSGSLIKVKIGLVSGRKDYDKKQLLKERSMDKEAKMQMKKFM